MVFNTPEKIWTATAPSNLALIKYAGKKDSSNLPLNASLSYTLDKFITKVEISSFAEEQTKDKWQALEEPLFSPKENIVLWDKQSNLANKNSATLLSEKAIKRFLNHFQFLKKIFDIKGFFCIKSCNNFPDSIGAASSASSFCALTKATYQLALSQSSNKQKISKFTPSCLSILSRQGSGSSCRSFFAPWALWEGEGAKSIDFPYKKFIHQMFVMSAEKKSVSSSVAHEKIKHLANFSKRVKRAENRLSSLILALKNQDWKKIFEICWEEFQDLHQVYESAGIFYRNKEVLLLLDKIKAFWKKEADGPLVTMDAGASIHLLYRLDQKLLAKFLLDTLCK